MRRTQQQRRDETRAKLLDGAIRCLSEFGYEGTTTRRISEASGVSLGAQSHHFPHRADLVVAAVEEVATRRVAELHELATDLPEEAKPRFAALLDILWADLSSEDFTVFVRVWVAADADEELYQRLVPVERMLTREIAQLVATLALDVIEVTPDLQARVRLAIAACRGLALSERFEPRGGRRRDPWPDIRPLLLELFVP